MASSPQVLQRYRAERAKGTPAMTALLNARYEFARPAEYAFLTKLETTNQVVDAIGPFSVEVKVVPDEDGRIGDDDVTGRFTDTFEAGCVKNTQRDWNRDTKWYRPSNYALKEAYKDYRRAGMSKSVAEAAVRELIQQEMYEDANRCYMGVVVTVDVNGCELAESSLWGIDEIPGYNPLPYLMEVAGTLIGETLNKALGEIPKALGRLNRVAEELRAAQTVWRANLSAPIMTPVIVAKGQLQARREALTNVRAAIKAVKQAKVEVPAGLVETERNLATAVQVMVPCMFCTKNYLVTTEMDDPHGSVPRTVICDSCDTKKTNS